MTHDGRVSVRRSEQAAVQGTDFWGLLSFNPKPLG